MSALIRQMVSRKRAAAVLQADLRERHDAIIAAAKGDAGPVPDHEWDGSRLRFKNPDGTWGEWVDLRGKTGKAGKAGERIVMVGGGGASFSAGLADTAESDDRILIERDGAYYSIPLSEVSEMEFAKRIDAVSDTLLYKGEATPGTAETAAAWRIRRIELSADGDMVETFADGSADFSFVWADHAALTYI